MIDIFQKRQQIISQSEQQRLPKVRQIYIIKQKQPKLKDKLQTINHSINHPIAQTTLLQHLQIIPINHLTHIMQYPRNLFTSSSQSMASLHNKRQVFSNQIRRQKRQEIKRQKRRQLFKNNERFFIPQPEVNQKQQQFMKYMQSLTFDVLFNDPNSHLAYVSEVMHSKKSCSWVRKKLSVVFVLVYQVVREMVSNARDRIGVIKDTVSTLGNREDYQSLQSQTIQNSILYNQVFFSPINNTKQLYFKEVNPYNPLGQQIDNQTSKRQQQVLNMNKINIELFLEFLIAITYEITPNEFLHSLKEYNICANPEFRLTPNHNFYNMPDNITYNTSNDYSPQMSETQLMISIFSDFQHMLMDIYRLSHNISYIIAELQQLWRNLKRLYDHQPIQQQNDPNASSIALPHLWFDVQKMFVKKSTMSRTNLRILQFFVNLSAHVSSQNQHFERFIHEMCILGEFQIIVRELGLSLQEYEMISQIYANLVEEEITWSIKNKEHVKERIQSQNRIEIEEEDSFNENVFPMSPGIYVELLEKLNMTYDNSNQKDELIYIVKTILQNYEVPPRHKQQPQRENEDPLHQKTQSLIMYECDTQKLSFIVADLFQRITKGQCEAQYLNDLFIVVCNKLIPYMLHVTHLSTILSIVIRNQNKMIAIAEQKQKHSNPHIFIIPTSQRKKRIIVQNIKSMIIECTNAMWVFYNEAKHQSPSNIFSLSQTDQNFSNIAKDFINSIIRLWQQNELTYCYNEFIKFVQTAIQTFPEYLVLPESNYEAEQKLVYLVEQLGAQCDGYSMEDSFIGIVETIMTYLCNMDLKSGKKDQSRIQGYFIRYKDQWQKIIQCIESVMTGKKCNNGLGSSFANRVHQVYQITEQMYNESLQNQQIQI